MKNLFFFILLCSASWLSAQAVKRPVICGNELMEKNVREQYPELHEAFQQTFEAAKHAPAQRTNDPLIINVVVHVIWNAPEENLHDSIIYEQIAGLNRDYNRLNTDTANLRTEFLDVAGSANIHFNLVEIVRVQTEQLFFVDVLSPSVLPDVKNSVTGGSDPWDTDAYLNIWVAKIQPIEFLGIEIGQLLGFAFPPNGLDNWPTGVAAPTQAEDGVVLDYRVVANNNPNTIEIPGSEPGELLTVEGRSATHEVGHYLGLRHIWGDGGFGGPNDCQQSDGIDDTPFSDDQSAFLCDKERNSCEQIDEFYQSNMPDLVENYMDYSAEDCMNMFTNGQVALMRNVLLGPRSGLLEGVSATRDENLNALSCSISPNPANEQINLQFELVQPSEISVYLYDVDGLVTVMDVNHTYPSGSNILGFNIEGLHPGLYFLRIKASEGGWTGKLLKL